MKEVDRIRLENTIQLGSLEDTVPVKRLEPKQIRRMRAQTHEQTKLKFSLIRWMASFWKNVNGSLSLMFHRPTKECDKNGHTPYSGFGGIVRCRYCGMEIQSLEELLKID